MQYTKFSFRKNVGVLIYGMALFLIYLAAENAITEKFNKYIVSPFFLELKPPMLFDLAFLLIAGWLIWRNFRKKLRVLDFVIILLYVYLRFISSTWLYMPLFSKGNYDHRGVSYIDALIVFYGFSVLWNTWLLIRKWKKGQDYPDGIFYPDLSLQMQASKMNLSISELDERGLKRNKFASEIAYVISQMVPFRAFAIGICGPWGSGKTSLIELIVSNVKAAEKNGKYIHIHFCPWFFSNSEMLIANFFSILEENFSQNRYLSSELKAYGKQIAMAEKTFLSSEFSKLVFDNNADLQSRYITIVEQIRNEGKVLMITIDDLDRLDKKEVVEVFRLIRLVADFPNTFYIVGYDRDYITAAIRQELTMHNPEKYIDKIFNVEFKIPELSAETLRERLEIFLRSQLKSLSSKVGAVHESVLQKCFDFEETVHIIGTERDLKRFSNNLIMRYLSIRQEINFYHFFLIELIYYRDGALFTAIYENRKLIIDRYEAMHKSSTVQGLVINDLLNREFDPNAVRVFEELFRKTSNPERLALPNKYYFNRYFSLTLLSTDFTHEQFEEAFRLPPEKLGPRLIEFQSINSILLKEKILAKASEIDFSDEKAVTNLIDACLILYYDIFYVRLGELTYEGLEAGVLAETLYKITIVSGTGPQLLSKRIMASDADDYSPIGFLFSPETFSHYALDNRIENYQEWRDVTLEIHAEMLVRNVNKQNPPAIDRILGQIMHARQMIRTDSHKEDDLDWFSKKIIIENRDFLIHNLTAIIKYLRQQSTLNNTFEPDKARKAVTDHFVDVTMPVYDLEDFRLLKDFHRGYETLNARSFTFSNQHPQSTSHPKFNDHLFPETFKWEIDDRFEITIEPIQTEAWRFGFRFSDSKDFETIATQRFSEKHSYIYLEKGFIDNSSINQKQEGDPTLDIVVVSGMGAMPVSGTLNPYTQKKLLFSAEKSNKLNYTIECSVEEDADFEFVNINLLKDLPYVKIVAWADEKPFQLNTSIRLLRKIK